MPDGLLLELRSAWRSLWTRPAFLAAVVLTLALGVGCNIAIFSVIHGLLLRPLPYPDGERLVYIHNSYPKSGVADAGVTVPDYLDRRAHAPALADSAIWHDYSYDLVRDDLPQRVAGAAATPSLFTTLGVQAALGRTFLPAEGESGQERVVLLSHGLWTREYGADRSLVGRQIRISGQDHRVVGVMPPGFAFPRREVQLWVPFVFSEVQKSDRMRGFEFAWSIGRLAPGATIAQLESQFDAIVARNLERIGGEAHGDAPDFRARVASGGFAGRAQPLHTHLSGRYASELWLLQAAVFLVLVTACVNVANLLLVRLSAREREFAVRSALGASRGRIARQLLIEAGLLAGLGGTVGVAVGWLGVGLLRSLGLDGSEVGMDIGLDAGVLVFALAACLLSAAICSLFPLLSVWRRRPLDALKAAARGSTGMARARRTRSGLVVVQVAFAGALLVVAGVLLHSYVRLQQQDPGFRSEGQVTASINLSRERYRDLEQTREFHRRALEAVRALPGVQSAASVSGMLFSGDYDSGPYVVDAATPGGADASRVGYFQVVDEVFFGTLGIPLLRGRGFLPSDTGDAPPVAVIDEQLARKAFGARDPIGARIATPGLNGLQWRTIVGVVASVKRRQLSEVDGMESYYFPWAQSPSRIFRIAIRTDLAPATIAAPLRAALAAIDPQQPVYDILGMPERIEQSLAAPRTPLLLLALFAAVALGLCAVGVYGVLAFAVSQRSAEIGVRLSLGASQRDILSGVLADAARLGALGLVCGWPLAWAATRQLQSQLFEVAPLDPLAWTAVSLLLAAVVLLAGWLPAQRAARVNPMEALRSD